MIGRNKNWSGQSDWIKEFNKVHNRGLIMAKKKSKRKIKNKKTIPLNIKSLGNKIESYPFRGNNMA